MDTSNSYMNHRAFNEDYAESVATTANKIRDPMKRMWCQTQWTTLSQQADALALLDVYFDLDTRLLDKLTNKRLWRLVVCLRVRRWKQP